MVALQAMAETQHAAGFGGWLHEIMDDRAIGPAQIARYAGVSPTTVKDWLHGYREPQPDTLRKLAKGLNIPNRIVFAVAYNLNGEEEYQRWYRDTEQELERWLAQGSAILRRFREGDNEGDQP